MRHDTGREKVTSKECVFKPVSNVGLLEINPKEKLWKIVENHLRIILASRQES